MGEGADEQQAVGVVAVVAAAATMTVDAMATGTARRVRWAPVVAAKREVELEVPAVKVQAKQQMWQPISTSTIATAAHAASTVARRHQRHHRRLLHIRHRRRSTCRSPRSCERLWSPIAPDCA